MGRVKTGVYVVYMRILSDFPTPAWASAAVFKQLLRALEILKQRPADKICQALGRKLQKAVNPFLDN